MYHYFLLFTSFWLYQIILLTIIVLLLLERMYSVIARCLWMRCKKRNPKPTEWLLAMESLSSHTYLDHMCRKKTITSAPFESCSINGMARHIDQCVSSVVNESYELFLGYTLCPRVVNLLNISSAKSKSESTA